MTVTEYLGSVAACSLTVEASTGLGPLTLDGGMMAAVAMLDSMRKQQGEVHLVGNGGSAAIVAHAQNDFVKAAHTRARVHQDIPLQSALSNDCGYEVAWAKSLNMLMRTGDVLIAVSSAGESASIINAVAAARKKHAMVITLSGFEPTNRLRQLGDLNFYVPSDEYGHVELTHAALLHHITDEVARA